MIDMKLIVILKARPVKPTASETAGPKPSLTLLLFGNVYQEHKGNIGSLTLEIVA